MKLFSIIILFFLISCNQPIKENNLKKNNSTENGNDNEWIDSIRISNDWIKLSFKPLDSINAEQINKLRVNDTYPFFQLSNQVAKKYIKDFSDNSSYGVYAISKQYCNENIISLLLFHWGDCIWDIYLVTIDRKNFDLIDSERILYLADNCSTDEINQKMTTYFSKNKFRVSNILKYWTSENNTEEDPTKKHIEKVDSSIVNCEILSSGKINREIKNVP